MNNPLVAHGLAPDLEDTRMRSDVRIPDEVIGRFAYKSGVSWESAVELFGRLELYLDNAAAAKRPPSKELDTAWHEFILHTRQYAEYCINRYGRYVHHVPLSPIRLPNETVSAESMNSSDCDVSGPSCGPSCTLSLE